MKIMITILCLTLSLMAKAADPQLTMSSFAPVESSLYTQLFERIYTEALRRLGYKFRFKIVPAVRASVEANNGTTDGEPGRLFGHNEKFPNLVRIEEPLLTVTFAAYATRSDIQVDGWKSIQERRYRVDVMRGLSFIRESGIDPSLIFELNDRKQAYQRLISGRADIYVDVAFDFSPLLRSSNYKNSAIREVCELSKQAAYGFLHKKHAALAPKLAEVFRQMKKEGLIEQYERELLNKSKP